MTFRSKAIALSAAGVIAQALGGWTVSTQSQAASFSCSRAQTPVERMICDTPELSQMDDQLAELFAQVRNDSRLPAEARDGILTDQRAWIGQTYECSDPSCLQALYIARIDQLQDQQQALASSASPEMSGSETAVPDVVEVLPDQASSPPEEDAPEQAPQAKSDKPMTPDQKRNMAIVLVCLAVGSVLFFISIAMVVRVYQRSKREFDYDMLWNKTSFLWLIYFVMLGLSGIGSGLGLVVFGPIAICCWLTVAYVNVRNTNLSTGLIGTFFAPISILLAMLGLMWIFNFTRRLNQGTLR